VIELRDWSGDEVVVEDKQTKSSLIGREARSGWFSRDDLRARALV
jgi:hypothetical protein